MPWCATNGPSYISEISDIHHMNYFQKLEVISRDFVISVQQVKNEKIIETSATQALIFITEAQHVVTMKN